MAIPVEMPKMSDTMEEGVLVAWTVDEGTAVSAGDIIAQVETDKATMDLEVYDDGVLLKQVVEAGSGVPIGGLIAILGEKGEDISEILAQYQGNGSATPASTEAPETSDAEVVQTNVPAPSENGGRIKASPLARRMAQEQGIELGTIQGSGPDGRVVKRDIEAILEGQPVAKATSATAPKVEAPVPAPRPAPTRAPIAPVETDTYTALGLTQMRKTITRRLSESKYTAPHFYLTVDVAMENAIAIRKTLNELALAQGQSKVSFNDFITKSCALALRQHPMVNGSYMEKEGEIRQHRDVHIGVAVAIDEGLLTPVIRHADRKGLAQLAEETRELAGRARERRLTPDEMQGGTFTTSNLGMFGIEEFTAIINPPNSCILAIGAIRDVPVVKEGMVVPGKQMMLTLSCDHRIVDGAVGSRFLTTVKQYLEEPMTLLL